MRTNLLALYAALALALYAALVLGLAGQAALAHSEGHGAKMVGHGPGGGSLGAVVLASEAELGAKARTRAIAEWKVGHGTAHVSLWEPDRKTPIAVPGGTELKWIVIGKRLAKPIVLKTHASDSGQLSQSFDPAEFEKADAIELILPSLGKSAEKHVAAHDL